MPTLVKVEHPPYSYINHYGQYKDNGEAKKSLRQRGWKYDRGFMHWYAYTAAGDYLIARMEEVCCESRNSLPYNEKK